MLAFDSLLLDLDSGLELAQKNVPQGASPKVVEDDGSEKFQNNSLSSSYSLPFSSLLIIRRYDGEKMGWLDDEMICFVKKCVDNMLCYVILCRIMLHLHIS